MDMSCPWTGHSVGKCGHSLREAQAQAPEAQAQAPGTSHQIGEQLQCGARGEVASNFEQPFK